MNASIPIKVLAHDDVKIPKLITKKHRPIKVNHNCTVHTPPELYVFEKDEQYLYFAPSFFMWFITNELGNQVLTHLFDGAAQEQIAALILHNHPDFEVNHDELNEFVLNYIAAVKEYGLISDEKMQPEAVPRVLAPTPFVLYLHLTERCNLTCDYCYNEDHRESLRQTGAERGGLEDFKKVIDDAAKLGFQKIKLTGGEVMMNKNAIALAKYAKSKDLIVNFMTNATLLKDEHIEALDGHVNAYSISLDSADEKLNDSIRGNGSFKKATDAIKKLKANGAYIHLNGVITKSNLTGVSDLLEFGYNELDADDVTVAPNVFGATPSQVGGDHLILDRADMAVVKQQEDDYYGKVQNGAATNYDINEVFRTSCGAGNGVVSVDSNGDVYPCQTMHTPQMNCGNVFDTSLETVVNESPRLKGVREMIVDDIERCGECAMRYLCGGGCRNEALTNGGTIASALPKSCNYNFTGSLNKLWNIANAEQG